MLHDISGPHGSEYDLSPCSLIEVELCFRGACYHHHLQMLQFLISYRIIHHGNDFEGMKWL